MQRKTVFSFHVSRQKVEIFCENSKNLRNIENFRKIRNVCQKSKKFGEKNRKMKHFVKHLQFCQQFLVGESQNV